MTLIILSVIVNNFVHADNDDDGEDAAGGRLAELLQVMGAEDVLVVVSRFFGGILLGPSRFKFINNSARSLLESLPWAVPAAATKLRAGPQPAGKVARR